MRAALAFVALMLVGCQADNPYFEGASVDPVQNEGVADLARCGWLGQPCCVNADGGTYCTRPEHDHCDDRRICNPY